MYREKPKSWPLQSLWMYQLLAHTIPKMSNRNQTPKVMNEFSGILQ